MLSRMGHCSSYDEIELVDTSLAREVLAESEAAWFFTPPIISPGVFVQVAGDNNDINEETLDGKHTRHATTLVLYQKGQFGQQPQHRTYADHSNKRSLESPQTCQQLREFSAHGKKPDVVDFRNQVQQEWFQGNRHLLSSASLMELAWSLVRLCSTKLFQIEIRPMASDQQNVPSWSAFSAMVNPVVHTPNTIGYCPMINGSPTEYSTVYSTQECPIHDEKSWAARQCDYL